jgi:hypothetical protein
MAMIAIIASKFVIHEVEKMRKEATIPIFARVLYICGLTIDCSLMHERMIVPDELYRTWK